MCARHGVLLPAGPARTLPPRRIIAGIHTAPLPAESKALMSVEADANVTNRVAESPGRPAPLGLFVEDRNGAL
ncbi:MAG: hypothetical protein LC808_10670 [Actinobacteria bacterium]|nr:hypothetical protein [Actinomycetota bacterium]